MQQYLQNKKGLVQDVFNQVFDKYDLMNDFMSLGVHRSWKKTLLNMMCPSKNQKLIDVACGTGDIGKLYLDNTDKNNIITCVDPNESMIDKGKEKLKKYKNIDWIISSAEKLPLKDNSYDAIFNCAWPLINKYLSVEANIQAIDFIYNLNQETINFDNVKFDNVSNNDLDKFISDFNSKKNVPLNKIRLKNFIAKLFSIYSG